MQKNGNLTRPEHNYSQKALDVTLPPNLEFQKVALIKSADGVALKLYAARQCNKLVAQAQDKNGQIYGSAENIVGIQKSPLYLKTSTGLQEILNRWQDPGNTKY